MGSRGWKSNLCLFFSILDVHFITPASVINFKGQVEVGLLKMEIGSGLESYPFHVKMELSNNLTQ